MLKNIIDGNFKKRNDDNEDLLDERVGKVPASEINSWVKCISKRGNEFEERLRREKGIWEK